MLRRNVLLLAFLVSVNTTATAQVVRTFVSTGGDDLNPCSRTEPCRTFGAAIAAVNTGGEVLVLDSGGYGPFTVDKAVSVISPGGIHAAIAATTGSAIIVEAGTAAVVIRNIFVNSQGATRGVRVLATGAVSIQDCTFQNLSSGGVVFSSAGQNFIRNCVFRNCSIGVATIGTSGFCDVLIEGCAFERGAFGIALNDFSRVTARDCSFMGATSAAIHLRVNSGNSVEGDIESCSIVRNAEGIRILNDDATSIAIVRVAQTRITGNVIGLATDAFGEIVSLGNNRVAGNGSTQAFTSTVAQQ